MKNSRCRWILQYLFCCSRFLLTRHYSINICKATPVLPSQHILAFLTFTQREYSPHLYLSLFQAPMCLISTDKAGSFRWSPVANSRSASCMKMSYCVTHSFGDRPFVWLHVDILPKSTLSWHEQCDIFSWKEQRSEVKTKRCIKLKQQEKKVGSFYVSLYGNYE